MYFVKRGDRYIEATAYTFREFMQKGLPILDPADRPTVGDWNNHLSTLFPDVRLKRYLEMRGADGGPWRVICALPAFWVGLLYDAGVLDEAWQMVRDWTAEERLALRDGVPRTALATPFRNRTVLDIARDCVELSRRGLARRARLNGAGVDETVFLDPVLETLAAEATPAERLLARYHGAWDGDIDRIFTELAY